MFKYIGNYKFLLILLFVFYYFQYNQITSFIILNKTNNIEDIKEDFTSKVEKNKLITYLKKIKIKVN